MHPLYLSEKPKKPIKAYTEHHLRCMSWEAEAALRMLENNLNPQIALKPDELIVYGGQGRAARNWKEYNTIVKTLKSLAKDETLLIQSGKAVGVIKTYTHAPRVLLANSNFVPKWATPENFEIYDQMGLTMYAQMTAGSWIYIGTQGILQGTYETFAALAKQHFNSSLKGKWVLSGGLGGMSGAQPLAITMNEGIALIVEVLKERIIQKHKEGYLDHCCDSLESALKLVHEALKTKKPLSIGLIGNTADILPKLVKKNILPDIVTDQTSAHDLMDYIPLGDLKKNLVLRETNSFLYKKKALEAILLHAQAILDMQKKGVIAFDYGNNLRGQAEKAGLKAIRLQNGKFAYPGFVPAYIRSLFCEGKGPFRYATLSGKSHDILTIDNLIMKIYPENTSLMRWLNLAKNRVPFIGLPARIVWLGMGERATIGLKINELIQKKKIQGPIVIGRDHLDCGSVASPYRETEAMLDGSDAIADWPLLNGMANVASGADWVSIHSGGGVGIGNSIHAGMVIVATGTLEKALRLERVLTTDPALGIMRHADAGYKKALEVAKKMDVSLPSIKP
ncbi:urocanate hydratase [Candidatus Peregrinibacteria bacterium]|nr:urocanate hydratase [Candidatus Peregrinibacteria bacterium]